MKVLVDARGDQILGFTMFSAEAGEVMSVVQTAMLGGLGPTRCYPCPPSHMAEGLNVLLARISGR